MGSRSRNGHQGARDRLAVPSDFFSAITVLLVLRAVAARQQPSGFATDVPGARAEGADEARLPRDASRTG
jgi:hypothetical protein